MQGHVSQAQLAELEARIAEQERIIADLNDMVVAQWRKIDSLERRVGELRDEFDAAALSRADGRDDQRHRQQRTCDRPPRVMGVFRSGQGRLHLFCET